MSDVEGVEGMNCVCGFEDSHLEGDRFIEVNLVVSMPDGYGSADFVINKYSLSDRRRTVELYACPKCGTVRIER